MAATTIWSTREGKRKQMGKVKQKRRREAREEMAEMTIQSTREGERKQKGQVKPERRREAREETAATMV
jgi:hypothetical protein